jgi:hypothetical protein
MTKPQEQRHFEHLDPNAVHPSPLLFEKGVNLCLALVIVGGLGSLLGWVMNPGQFYFSYLASWAYCWTILMGVLFFVMLHYLVDAGWDTVIRRPAEQLLSVMPIMVLGLIPIVIGMASGKLYPWVHPSAPLGGFKGWFLSLPVTLVFLGIDAAIWLILAHVLRRNSLAQDADGAAKWTTSSRRWSAGGIVLYALSATTCSFHLLMSLDYHWYSTMFGVYVWTGSVVAGLAAVSLLAIALRRGPLKEYIGSDTFHTIGELTFAFVCFWGYIAFSQYFLIWYGNLPEETIWFLRRWTGETAAQGAWWWPVACLIGLGQFVLPFVVLMGAPAKRNRKVLGTMCAIMLLTHWLNTYWIVQPEKAALYPPLQWIWIDLSVVVLLGGVSGMLFISRLRRAALFPMMDPRLVDAFSGEHVEEIEQADVE